MALVYREVSFCLVHRHIPLNYAVILVPSRPLPPDDTAVHAKLVEIQLKYIWKTIQPEGSDASPDTRASPPLRDDTHPFGTRLLLPISLLLMEAHHKFLTWHLVK